MQSGDLVAVVRMNGYRFEDVFLSQALRIQNFISLRSLVRQVFRRWRKPPGDSLPRDLLRHEGRSMLITGNMPGWRSSTASSRHVAPSVITKSLGTRSFTAISTGGSEEDDRAELRRCVFGALLQYQTVDKALERLLQVDHLPAIRRKQLTYLKARMTIASIQVDHGEYLYLADKFGFEPVMHKDAFRPLVWDETRHNPEHVEGAAWHSLTAHGGRRHCCADSIRQAA